MQHINTGHFATCSGCGEGTGYAWYGSKLSLMQDMVKQGWRVRREQLLCPDCVTDTTQETTHAAD